jgi:arsenate reductase
MVTLYGIPNCDTVKKARTWLEKNGVAYHFHDYKKEGVAAERIRKWYEAFPREKLVNKAATTWKDLSAEEKAAVVDDETAITLMTAKTSLIKRPLIEDASGSAVALGFDAKRYEEIFL